MIEEGLQKQECEAGSLEDSWECEEPDTKGNSNEESCQPSQPTSYDETES